MVARVKAIARWGGFKNCSISADCPGAKIATLKSIGTRGVKQTTRVRPVIEGGARKREGRQGERKKEVNVGTTYTEC